ncbi:unnamed protein product [Euphydryas editha]|uniref:Decaprenyl-diphosphate synthase subunit 1 n=1 Tax=Euphydryas editha TaxID=104508 RepID=A0AAU9V1F0_EUPED|nr:unnamed protein product [Euphydryas editha]
MVVFHFCLFSFDVDIFSISSSRFKKIFLPFVKQEKLEHRVTTCGPACGSAGSGAVAGSARRLASSLQSTSTGSLPDYGTQIVDPYRLLEDDLNGIYEDIRAELERNTNQPELNTIATYYFDGQGKALRPMVAILMARAVNYHVYGENSALLPSQRQVAMISEMIHSASLIHDDVIDQSDFRRGKPSVNVLWNHKKAPTGKRKFSFSKGLNHWWLDE